MEELSEDDKLTVARARKIQKFLSQAFFVAEQFTGTPGQYVPLKETIRGFKEILEANMMICRKVLSIWLVPLMMPLLKLRL